jgi:hypothetical protein
MPVKAGRMRAVTAFTPGNVRLEQVSMPTPDPDEVLVAVEDCGEVHRYAPDRRVGRARWSAHVPGIGRRGDRR